MKKIAQVIGSKRLTAEVLAVAETVKNLNRRFSFDVIIPKDAEYRERFLGLGARVISLDGADEVSARAVRRFKRYFTENRADVVHTYASVGAKIGARLAGIKACISSRGFISKKEERLKRFSSPIYNAFTTLTICTSDSIFDALVREGVHRERILTLLPPGIVANSKMGDAQSEEGLIVCPLPFYRGFGQKTLLRAFARMHKSPSCRLAFVGDGPEKEDCRFLAGRLGIGGRVEFYTSEMLTKIYKMRPALSVFTQEESWELPCALLYGARTPTVSSDIPENKDLFGDASDFYLCGDVFSLERAITRCLAQRASPIPCDSKFTPLGVICEAYERIYTALLSL